MKVAILFLAAALGSASASPAQNSQNACDCDKRYQVAPISEDEGCPLGYTATLISGNFECVQPGCSAEEYANCRRSSNPSLKVEPAVWLQLCSTLHRILDAEENHPTTREAMHHHYAQEEKAKGTYNALVGAMGGRASKAK
ncbi:hypothetical protein MAC_05783 [Metarhizium acridum CQMa 102]|uniref:Extracellular membrane protein CFEM domain-containing protein n=1 Tax=Metarhizium acridum (strain CQMa 102) TaxID=655827 RepID=E9E7D5_METAQ|nr:uncharacterized protein MAC_05783 [Metarhizium acridum CQMa 102]EFY88177.1 hypothetical protein MAC_05783 [Metarhizium acridum CQMa 102]